MGKLSGKMVLTAALAVLLSLFSWGPTPSRAAGNPDTRWIAPVTPDAADWAVPDNWDFGVPSSGTYSGTFPVNAFIDNGGTAQISSSDAAAQNLTVGQNIGMPASTVLHLDQELTVAGTLTLGQEAVGSSGNWQGADGLYFMDDTGSGSPNLVAGTLIVSDKGYGAFLQQGGTVTVTNNLILGNQILAGGTQDAAYPISGQYLMWQGNTAPSLTVGGQLIVGNAGYGGFEQYSGSMEATGSTAEGSVALIIGKEAGSQGTYRLENDARLTVGRVDFPTTMYVGQGGSGYLSIDYYGGTGGDPYSFKVFGDLVLGDQTGSWGMVEQNSGKATVTGNLTLGNLQGGYGQYNLSEYTYADEMGYVTTYGPTSLDVGGNLTVGSSGQGNFFQYGGTVTVNQDLILGQQAASYGNYYLTKASDYSEDEGGSRSYTTGPTSLTVDGKLIVGQSGDGLFYQSGGTATVGQDLILGQQQYSWGEYYLLSYTESQEGGGWSYNVTYGPASLTVGGSLIVGQSGYGSFTQAGGTATVSQNLILGQQATSSGDYYLSSAIDSEEDYTDTNLLASLTVEGSFIAGQSGTGSFTQEGGTVTVNRDLILGQQAASSGTYSLFGGTQSGDGEGGPYTYTTDSAYLTVGGSLGGSLIVGQNGEGGFKQEGGSVTAHQDLILGQQAASSGAYSLFGGTRTSVDWLDSTTTGSAYLTVGGSLGGNLVVGQSGSGAFSQDGGSVTVGQDLILGKDGLGTSQDPPASGSYHLFEGDKSSSEGWNLTTEPASLEVQGSLIVGQYGEGSFTQEGGSVTVRQDLILGQEEYAHGNYTLFAGTGEYANGEYVTYTTGPASLDVQGSLIVGNIWSGQFTQTGGTVTVGGPLILGKENSSEGNYSLSNGATLTIWGLGPTAMIVGEGGMGSFFQENSELAAYGDVIVGDLPGSNGQVNQTFGNARVTGSLTVGNQGYGSFYQYGSSMQVDNALIIAAGNNGDYTVTSGDISAGAVRVGAGGSGNLTLYDSFLSAVGMYVGESSWGHLSMDYSQLTSGELVAGDQPGGHGEVYQNGGTAEVNSYLTLGNLPGSTGSYSLDDGSLTVGQVGSPTTMTVGAAGEGHFYQGGGSFTVNGDMLVGDQAGGSGLVEQYGGTATVTGDLIVGNERDESSSSGGYVMYAGGPSLEVQSNLIVGNAGIGDFRQEGGQVEVFGSLVLGDGATTSGGWDGVYNHWGGSLTVGSYGSLTGMIVGSRNRGLYDQTDGTLLVYGNLTVGDQGDSVGAVEHTGGTVTVTDGDLVLGNERGEGAASGSYHLFAEESSLNSPSLEVNGSLIAGNKGNGDFTQEGGAVSVADGDLILGLEGWGNGHYPAIGSYSLFEGTKVGVDWEYTTGSASLEVSKSLVVGQYGEGSFTHEGGSVTVNQNLILGQEVDSSGNYSLFAGTGESANGEYYTYTTGPAVLNVLGDMYVGQAGTGTFTQSGGTVFTNHLEVGAMAGSSGLYQMNGGTLNVLGSDTLILGRDGASGSIPAATGKFTLLDGFLTVGQTGAPTTMYVGQGGIGTFYLGVDIDFDPFFIEMGGNPTFSLYGDLVAGDQAGSYGRVFQLWSTATVTGNLILGTHEGADSDYSISDGTYSTGGETYFSGPAYLDVGGSLIAGQAGKGGLAQTGSTVTVGQDLILGQQGTSDGYYELFAGTESGVDEGRTFTQTTDQAYLTLGGSLIVGQYGSGSFDQHGGSVTVAHDLVMGQQQYSNSDFHVFEGTKSGEDEDGPETETTSPAYLTVGGSLILGQAGEGDVHHHGGSVTVGHDLILGQELSGSGVYFLVEGTGTYQNGGTGSFTTGPASLNVGGNLIVGQNGQGTFNQVGGTLNSPGSVVLGQEAGSAGTYTMQNGTLNAQNITVGHGGQGTFTQNGGSLTFGMGGQLYVGLNGSGTYTQNGGSVNFVSSPTTTDYLKIGVNGGTGTYTLQGEADLSVDGMTIVGLASPGSTSGGTGYFSQYGGTHTIFRTPSSEADGGRLLLGNRANTYGEYRLSGGLLEVGGKELLGLSEPGEMGGTGVFVQTGGTNTISGYTQPDGFGRLVAGWYDNSVGTYELQGGLFTPDRIYLGYTGENPLYPDQPLTSGKGTLSISGGDLVAQQIVVGWNMNLDYGGFGLLELTSQNAHVETQGLYVNTTGIFTAAPGSVLNIANTFQNNSTNTQSAGNLTFGTGGQMVVGDTGTGTFNQTGGSVTFNSSTTNTNYLRLRVGANGGTGTYYLEDTAALTVDGMVWVGFTNNDTGGSGSFIQSGGTHSIFRITDVAHGGDGGRLNLGSGQGTYGYYELTGGQLEVGGKVTLGMSAPGKTGGTGHFVQTGGTHTITDYTLPDEIGRMGVGIYDNTVGIYELQDGVFTADKIIVGYDGTINPVFPDQPLASGQGTFTMSGGSMAVKDVIIGWHENLGNGGFGRLELTGQNAHVEADNLNVGPQGIVTMATGAIFNLANNLQNNGTFTQTGGTLNSLQSMVLGQETGTRGSYNLQDGVVNAQYLAVGNSGQGTFTQSGGSLTVNNTLTVKEATGTGTFIQNGGDSNIINFINNGTVQFNNLSNTEGSSAFIGAMDNYGEVRVTNSTITFGSYDEHGAYISDPSITIIQTDLTVHNTGYLLGNTGDTWQIGNDFFNTSTLNTDWNTRRALLGIFQGPEQDNSHNLQLAGTDLGAYSSGYLNNFAWGILDLDDQEVSLQGSGKALYVGEIRGADIVSGTVTNITGNGLNVYYDLDLNRDVLNGGTYTLAGVSGGNLIPVPFVTTQWNLNGDADWQTPGYWSQDVPLSTEDAFIDTGNMVYIQSYNAVAQNLVVGDTNSGGVYQRNGYSLTVNYDLILGNYGGTGTYTQEGGGTVSVGQDLILGNLTPDSYGSYNIFDESSSLTVSRDLIVGHKGEGYFFQNGGTVSVVQNLILGDLTPDSSGTYEIYNEFSSLTVSGNLIVGRYGYGRFYQDGGSLTGSANVIVGDQAGSYGEVEQYGGTAEIQGKLLVGNAGSAFGKYNLAHGTLTVGQVGSPESNMVVGSQGAGYFLLETDPTFTLHGNLVAADQPGSTGVVLHYGGDATVNGNLSLGVQGPTANHDQLAALGSYSMSYLNLPPSLTVTGNIEAGVNGIGGFSQQEGFVEADEVVIGRDAGGLGVYTMDGGSLNTQNLSVGFASTGGTFQFPAEVMTPYGYSPLKYAMEFFPFLNYLYIDDANNTFTGPGGNFYQYGGTITTHHLEVGALPGSWGYYQMNGDCSLDIAPDGGDVWDGALVLGRDGASGSLPAASGTFDLGGGSLTAEAIMVGDAGQGTFSQFSDTAMVTTRSLVLGSQPGSFGEYYLSDGALTVGEIDTPATTTVMTVGDGGESNFSQDGGSLTVNGALVLGNQADSYGSYSLSSYGVPTVLEVQGNLMVGKSGQGQFTQYSGELTVNGNMVVSDQAGSYGSVSQLGGTATVTGNLALGATQYANGHYFLSAGTSTYNWGGSYHGPASLDVGSLTVGQSGIGSFSQEGGTATVTGDLTLGKEQNAGGEYSFFEGTRTYEYTGSSYTQTITTDPASLDVQGRLIVGQSGFGSFSQGGGTVTVNQDIILGQQASSSGSYSLSEGTYFEDHGYYSTTNTTGPAFLNVGGSHNIIVGQGGTGTFTQSGGSLTVGTGGQMLAGWFDNSVGTYEMSGGTFRADQIILGNNGTSTNPLYPTQPDASGQGKMTIGGDGNVVVKDLIVGDVAQHGTGGFGWLDLASQDAYVEVTEDFIVGGQGIFTAVPGAIIHMTGTNFIVTSDNQENLTGFKNLKLIFTGGPGVTDIFELGAEVGSVEIGAGSHVHFVNTYDNNQAGNEVMQIDYLVLNPGATIDFFEDDGAGSEYVNIVNLILQDGAALNTAVLNQNDLPFLHVDKVTNVTTHTPIPASLLLLGTGLLGLGALGWRRRRQG